jgi:hypothetical protein
VEAYKILDDMMFERTLINGAAQIPGRGLVAGDVFQSRDEKLQRFSCRFLAIVQMWSLL